MMPEINFNINVKGLEKFNAGLNTAANSVRKVSHNVKSMGATMNTQLSMFENSMLRTSTHMENTRSGAAMLRSEFTSAFGAINKRIAMTRGQILGIGFGFLFAGMAANRFFKGFLTSSYKIYKEAEGNNSLMVTGLGRLNAAWSFFKFSMIDALSRSDLFMNLIEMLIKTADWFGGLSEGSKKAFGIMTIAIVGVTGFFMLFGQVLLFVSSAGILLFSAIIASVLIFAGISIILFKIWDDGGTRMSNILASISDILGGILLTIGLIQVAMTKGIKGKVLVIFGLLLIWVSLLINKMGNDWEHAVIGMKMLILNLGIAVYNTFKTIGEIILNTLIRIGKAANKLGLNIDVSSMQRDLGLFTSGVDSKINALKNGIKDLAVEYRNLGTVGNDTKGTLDAIGTITAPAAIGDIDYGVTADFSKDIADITRSAAEQEDIGKTVINNIEIPTTINGTDLTEEQVKDIMKSSLEEALDTTGN